MTTSRAILPAPASGGDPGVAVPGIDDTAGPVGAADRVGLSRLPSAGPVITPAGGFVLAGTVVTVESADAIGQVFYTTDGSDPRLPGGGVSPTAIAGSAPQQTTTTVTGFDDAAAPALPPGWAATTTASNAWRTVAGTSDAGPNSAFVNTLNSVSDARLTSAPFAVEAGSRQLRFRHHYDVELLWDGGVLEVSLGGGPFVDLLAAGGAFLSGGYNQTLQPSSGNPLQGRPAWSGDSEDFITTEIELPASAIGQDARLRWRYGSDTVVSGGEGWFVDSVQQLNEFTPPSPVEIVTDTILTARTLIGDAWSEPTVASFRVAAPPVLPGDYNRDGVVDAADFTVWRDALGSAVALPNDATPGAVTIEDYLVWRENFGETVAAPVAAPGLVSTQASASGPLEREPAVAEAALAQTGAGYFFAGNLPGVGLLSREQTGRLAGPAPVPSTPRPDGSASSDDDLLLVPLDAAFDSSGHDDPDPAGLSLEAGGDKADAPAALADAALSRLDD